MLGLGRIQSDLKAGVRPGCGIKFCNGCFSGSFFSTEQRLKWDGRSDRCRRRCPSDKVSPADTTLPSGCIRLCFLRTHGCFLLKVVTLLLSFWHTRPPSLATPVFARQIKLDWLEF